MITESDFNDLIDIDRDDRRRYAFLTAIPVAAGLASFALTNVTGGVDSFGLLPQTVNAISLAVAAVGSAPAMRIVTLSRNMDRIDKIRRRWKRLRESVPDTDGSLTEIETLVSDCYK